MMSGAILINGRPVMDDGVVFGGGVSTSNADGWQGPLPTAGPISPSEKVIQQNAPDL